METAEFRSTVSIKEGKKMQTTSEAQFKKKKKPQNPSSVL